MAAESLASIPVDSIRITYRRVGVGPPLLVLNGFAATSADWDPAFIHGVASSNELILLDHAGSVTPLMTESHSILSSSRMMRRMQWRRWVSIA